MALIATQPLPVGRVIYTSSYSNKLTFVLPAPYLEPLFLQTIVITRVTSQPSSSLTPGVAATSGGKALIYLNAADFAALVAQRVLPFKVVLSYDDVTLDVIKLELQRDASSVTASLVQRLVVTLVQSAA
jgi:hypothetical protein